MDDALDAMLEAQMEAEGNLFDDFAELQGQGRTKREALVVVDELRRREGCPRRGSNV